MRNFAHPFFHPSGILKGSRNRSIPSRPDIVCQGARRNVLMGTKWFRLTQGVPSRCTRRRKCPPYENNPRIKCPHSGNLNQPVLLCAIPDIDPNESLRITFSNSSVDTLVTSVRSGDLRIATHVQQIGINDDSAAYVTSIPEPSSTFLLGLAGFAPLARRKR